MGNSNKILFRDRTIYKSKSLNDFINNYIYILSRDCGTSPESLWDMDDINELKVYDVLDEDIIEQIIRLAEKYPVYSLYGQCTSLKVLKKWKNDGTYDQLIKLSNKDMSKWYISANLNNLLANEAFNVYNICGSKCHIKAKYNDVTVSLPSRYLN